MRSIVGVRHQPSHSLNIGLGRVPRLMSFDCVTASRRENRKETGSWGFPSDAARNLRS